MADAIEAVRDELRRAQDAGAGSDVRFAVGAVEIEFAVEVERSAGGEASIKVLSLLSLGATAARSTADTHRVTVTLAPVARDGKPFEVSSSAGRRPGG
ncbi:trypco2 family protein [Cellulomonas xylanilytica]|uniref:trypco2 family protein n=1 Tax=Cellulomonas xylanilytica TaxID=233583 RepID=UPI001649D246|nr:trypco2 family protein [Cellulomonas xylanilytica]